MSAFFLAAIGVYNAIPSWLKKGIALFLIGAVIFIAGDVRGARVTRAKCEAQAARAQTAANAQDLQAEKDGRAQDLKITNDLQEQAKVDHETIEQLKAKLAASPKNAPCVYDKSTADPDDPPRRVRKHW